MTVEERILAAYTYATKNAYRFESVREFREDLIHDTIVELYNHIDKFSKIHPKTINSWVYTVMQFKTQIYGRVYKNTQYIRKDKLARRLERVTDPLPQLKDNSHEVEGGWLPGYFDKVAGGVNSPDVSAEYEDVLSCIHSSKIGGSQRTLDLFTLHYQGYKTKELAEMYGMKSNAVTMAIKNTLKRIEKYTEES